LGRSEVEAGWEAPSLLDGYSVAGLAGHAFNTAEAVERYLQAPVPTQETVPAAAYYGQRFSDRATAAAQVGIMERGQARGAEGPTTLRRDTVALVQRLKAQLASAPPDRVVVVMGGTALRLDDYLETRLVELVVHGEDLAASVGVPSELPAEAVELVINHLLAVAHFRHGDLAVVRAFARRERDTSDALRVL
jgi:uncharacterized protein (TIGR03083 family)